MSLDKLNSSVDNFTNEVKKVGRVITFFEGKVAGFAKAVVPTRVAPKPAFGERIRGAFQAAGNALRGIGKNLGKVSKSEWKAGTKFMKAAGDVAEDARAAGPAADAGGFFGGLLDIIIKLFQPVIDLFKPLIPIFQILSFAIAEAMMPAMQELISLLTDPAVIQSIIALGNLIGTALTEVILFLNDILKDMIADGGFEALTLLFRRLAEDVDWSFLVPIFTAFLDQLIIMIKDVDWKTFIENLNTLIPLIVTVFNLIGSVVKLFSDLIKGLVDLVAFFTGKKISEVPSLEVPGIAPPVTGPTLEEALAGIPPEAIPLLEGMFGSAQTGAFVRRGGAVIVHDQERILSPEATRAMGLEEGGMGMKQGNIININVHGVTDIPTLARMIRDEQEMLLL